MERSLKMLAKEAKRRMKRGFWQECDRKLAEERSHAKAQGINENKLEEPDGFYLRVKQLLLEEGEVSDAIGRLTDRAYYETLSYAEKQRYNLELSERYLHALERFKREYEFEIKGRK